VPRKSWIIAPLLVMAAGCSSGQSTLPATATQPALVPPIVDARAVAEELGQIARATGDATDLGMGDDLGDFGIRDAWEAAGWPTEGFGPASPTSIDVHPLRGADTVDVPFVAYAVLDTQGRCFLGAVTFSPAGPSSDGSDRLTSVVVPGLSYRPCTSQVAADEFGSIVGTMHGDQP
jgi:hypothetical protein